MAFFFAYKTVAAIAGAVVSNPTPRKTTSFCGLFFASFIASMGEYTIWTFAPEAMAFFKLLPSGAGTRIKSPKVANKTFSFSASFKNVATSESWVTHTGQPGPDKCVSPSGSMERSPL